MNKYAIEAVRAKYEGENYDFPIGVNAENVASPEKMMIAFESVEAGDNLPQSNSKLGQFLAQIVAWLSKLKKGLDEKVGISAVEHTTVTEFEHDIIGSVSIAKYGCIVIVTLALTTYKTITDDTVIFSDNSIIPRFGIPEHDFYAAMAHSTEGVLTGKVGTISVKPDTGLRVAFPETGQYDGTLVYFVKNS